jgi:hypothetical protein
MNKSEFINELAAALAKAQGAMTAAKMDATNPFLKNKYADLGSVIQAAKGPLAANGLSYTQHPSLDAGAVTVTTILMHASGQWIESAITLPFEKGNGISLAQSMGAVITYMRRYTLSGILGIYADEDNDGNEGDKKPAKAATPAPAKVEEKADPPAANARPYAPAILRAGLDKKANRPNARLLPEELQSTTAALEVALGGEDKRHEFIRWLTDGKFTSMKDLTPGMVLALRDWLKPNYNRDAKVFEVGDVHAKAEANAAHTEWLRANGAQGELL